MAQSELGHMHDKGYGVALDLAEALWLYKLAAAQGLVDAFFNLGEFCEEGWGVRG
jgi:TPR repeat protein